MFNLIYRVTQNTCHLNVTTAHVCSNIKGQEIDIRNYIPVIEDTDVLTVKRHSPEGKQKKLQKQSFENFSLESEI